MIIADPRTPFVPCEFIYVRQNCLQSQNNLNFFLFIATSNIFFGGTYARVYVVIWSAFYFSGHPVFFVFRFTLNSLNAWFWLPSMSVDICQNIWCTVCVYLLWHCEYFSDILLVTLPSQASWKIHFFSYLIITKFLFSVLVNPCKECSFWRYSNKQMLIKQISYPLVSVKTVLGNIFCSPKKIHFLWDSPDFSQLGQQCHIDNIEVWIL